MSHWLSIEAITGIGPQYAKRLNKLGIYTLFDLLLFTPRTYQVHKFTAQPSAIEPGDKTIIVGKVVDLSMREGRRRMLTAQLDCQGEYLVLKFFHFYPNQIKMLSRGNFIRATGGIKKNLGFAEMIHPRIELIDADKIASTTQYISDTGTQHLEPIYPLTEGMNNQKIKQFIALALKHLEDKPLAELLPRALMQRFKWEDINRALAFIHAPHKDIAPEALIEMRHPVQQRLSFEELLAHRLALKKYRHQEALAPQIKAEAELIEKFLNHLAFKPTAAQWRCFNEIKSDLNLQQPMLRLLQGDVGAGKTLVAQLAALAVISQGYQVAFMAPTEILAEQHYLKTAKLFEILGIKVAYLVGKLSSKTKKALYAGIAAGEYALVIGTHALIQDQVKFKNLALVIIDEQHRFGVSQRLMLQQKGQDQLTPHQLIMTATPIPRTLAMSIYAELAISVIDELPLGRRPIQTTLLSQEKRDALIHRISKACERGKQAYWVCPLIEASDVVELEAAEVTYKRLVAELPHLRIGLIHGRMKSIDKSKIMEAFKAHELDLLVATTVIEVGVDVPNASIMVIENPERMGLSQLHQLRGRVGRGTEESYCVLLYQAPMGPSSYQRLVLLRDHHDGFYLAEEDLKMRGPGEFLGTRQTGGVNFRLASLMRDAPMLKMVNETAKLMQAQHLDAVEALVERWFGSKTQFVKA